MYKAGGGPLKSPSPRYLGTEQSIPFRNGAENNRPKKSQEAIPSFPRRGTFKGGTKRGDWDKKGGEVRGPTFWAFQTPEPERSPQKNGTQIGTRSTLWGKESTEKGKATR